MNSTKVFIILAMTVGLSITITIITINNKEESPQLSKQDIPSMQHEHVVHPMPSKRVSRFLAADYHERNPNAADHCHKDHEVCSYMVAGKNTTCCNNKCIDLSSDNKNCGACKKKCKYSQTCCRGECVSVAYDKRHCGYCNHRCQYGQYCVYGMCGYA